MKNLAVAITFLFALTGVVHTLDAEAKQDVRVVQPGLSAPVAFADEVDELADKKKKKKKKGEREEDEEEYRAFAGSPLEAVDPGALEAALKLRGLAAR